MFFKPLFIDNSEELYRRILKRKVVRGLQNLYKEALNLEAALDDTSREPTFLEIPPEHQFIRFKYGFDAGTYYRYENFIMLYSLMRGSVEINSLVKLINELVKNNKTEFDKFYNFVDKSKLTYNYHRQRVNLVEINKLIGLRDEKDSFEEVIRSKLVHYLLMFENDSFFQILGYMLDLSQNKRFNIKFFNNRQYRFQDGNLNKNKLAREYQIWSKNQSVGKCIKLALDFELRNLIAHNDYDFREKFLVGLVSNKRISYEVIIKKMYTLQGLYNGIPLLLGKYDFEDKKEELASKGIFLIALSFREGSPCVIIYQFWPFALLSYEFPWIKTVKFNVKGRETITTLSGKHITRGKMDKVWKEWHKKLGDKKEVKYFLIPIIPATGVNDNFFPLSELNNTYEMFYGFNEGILKVIN